MDYTKLYTARQAAALYNKCRIRDNPFNYSLKGNLILNQHAGALQDSHIQNIEYGTEETLVRCAGRDVAITSFVPYFAKKYDAASAYFVVKDRHVSICLKELANTAFRHVVTPNPCALYGSVEMEMLVKYIVALDSVRSCVNELFYLTTSLEASSYGYEDFHTFKPLKEALESDHKCLPVFVERQPATSVGIYLNTDVSLADSTIFIAKNLLNTMEILWAHFSDKDPKTRQAFVSCINANKGMADPILQKIVNITPTALILNPEFEMIQIEDTAKRFKAYQEYFRLDSTRDWIHDLATKSAIDSEMPLVNDMMIPFLSFCQCKALYTHRVETVRILYLYCKEKGTLPEDFEDSDAASAGLLEAALDQEHSELMPLTHSQSYAEGKASSEPPKIPRVSTDLDTRTGTYTLGRYQMKVERKRVVDESQKILYEKVMSKVSLICKEFTKKVKEIRTYNTGGKNPGQRSGKLDPHTMYKYRETPDIFYNNTYKQLESDLAFGIILDISGSMYGRGIENGKITMILLHETLKALGINHSIIGHTSEGYHDVVIEKYQSFREESGYTTYKNYALASLEAQSGNCDSGALYYMHQCMKRVRNKDKIMLIFSDGEPTECTEDELIEEVRSIEQDGIKVIGIGINFPNIARYYNDYANGRHLKDMLDIVSRILQEYILKKGTD